MKWQMITNRHFYMEYNGYIVNLFPFDAFYPLWTIFKDLIPVDHAQNYAPITTKDNKELAAKAQIERILKSLPPIPEAVTK